MLAVLVEQALLDSPLLSANAPHPAFPPGLQCRYLARVIIPRPVSSVTPSGQQAVAAAPAASRASAHGALQPSGLTAGTTAAPHAPASGSNPPPGCPFHRAMSGGSSLLQRLGVGGSRPGTSGVPAAEAAGAGPCPVSHDTAAVLGGLSFPADSQFADPAVAAQAAADIAASLGGTGTRPGTQGGASAAAGSGCPFPRPSAEVDGAAEAEQADGEPASGGQSEQHSMGVSSSEEAPAAAEGGRAELEAAGGEEDVQDAEGAEGGSNVGEEQVDAAEMAHKMQLVQNWLTSQRGEGEPAGAAKAAAADTIAAGGAGSRVGWRPDVPLLVAPQLNTLRCWL